MTIMFPSLQAMLNTMKLSIRNKLISYYVYANQSQVPTS